MCDLVKGRNDVWFGRETTPHMRTIGVAEPDISLLLYFKALVTYIYKSNSQQQQQFGAFAYLLMSQRAA